jgi:ABC-2 type transport system ATP-binding protein
MDEPSAALDPRQRARLWEYIGGLSADGTTVVFATHTVAEAERYADRVLVLADGEALFWGAPQELKQRVGRPGDLESAFIEFLRDQGH